MDLLASNNGITWSLLVEAIHVEELKMVNETNNNNSKQKRKEFLVKIGPKLREVLDDQKRKIEDVTYNCVKPSDYEAGEIVAKKINGEA